MATGNLLCQNVTLVRFPAQHMPTGIEAVDDSNRQFGLGSFPKIEQKAAEGCFSLLLFGLPINLERAH
jgi:hypothetical protein